MTSSSTTTITAATSATETAADQITRYIDTERRSWSSSRDSLRSTRVHDYQYV